MQKILNGYFGVPVITLMIAVALGLLTAAATKTTSLRSKPISALASEIAGPVAMLSKQSFLPHKHSALSS
jgi:hypothetical protein